MASSGAHVVAVSYATESKKWQIWGKLPNLPSPYPQHSAPAQREPLAGAPACKRNTAWARAPLPAATHFSDNSTTGATHFPRDCRCPSHRGAVDRRNTKRGDATQRTARRRTHCVRLRGPQNFENTRGVSSRSLLLRLPFRLQVHCWTLLAPTRPPGYSRAAAAPAAAAATRPRLALHALLPLGL